ncbi:hypothetical protein EXD82_03225 [Peptacetobacter hominis]|uniref:Uncharacterized protein n=1 Tax=Peptacetobacter hominis TaxID=2743610 RepID=A0A544QWR1_9FIRM|nr:hypothetical protein [Peptacetobacter hominis]TQQ85121.1 hypothetical protein EXD82_03225 [Peptacetobacter hominis]
MIFFLRYRHYIYSIVSTIALFVMLYLYKVEGWNIPTVEFLGVLIFLFAGIKGITENKKHEKEELEKNENTEE